MNRAAVVLLAHGSRDPSANAEFEAIVALYQERRPGQAVHQAYIELADPPLDPVLDRAASSAERVAVVPLFLLRAGHVKNDLGLALAAARTRHPRVQFVAADALGVDPLLAELAHLRAREALPELDGAAVVMVGRGSSDPDANGDFCKLVRLTWEGRGAGLVLPCFIGITGPRVPETLELAARARPRRLLVLPYLLFAGQLADRLAGQLAAFSERYPWIGATLAAHLGADPRLFALIDRRIEQALDGTATLPCDTCRYRVELPGHAHEVGGLRALLWSLRHGFTHNQAAPHEHAHRPLDKHVLVCGNVDCAERGSIALIDRLRRGIKQAGAARRVRVTRTSCMGRCGEGPTVAVYPDGVWYRGVRESDADELLALHLLGDRLVARLVDQIMQ